MVSFFYATMILTVPKKTRMISLNEYSKKMFFFICQYCLDLIDKQMKLAENDTKSRLKKS